MRRIGFFREENTLLKRILLCHWGWVVVLAVLCGFWVRGYSVLHGFEAFNSDEAVKYQFLQNIASGKNHLLMSRLNLLQLKNIWLPYWFYVATGERQDFFPFLACLVNEVLYLLWAWVLAYRLKCWEASLPLLAALAIPPPEVAFLGTHLTEFRFSFFVGALLVGFAGKWGRDTKTATVFGLLSGFGLWEDFFTILFILPVVIYEFKTGRDIDVKKMAVRSLLALAGGCVGASCSRALNFSLPLYSSGYVHWGLSSPKQWYWHLCMLLEKWPSYWAGEVPWGYLQNSELGRLLHPPDGFGWILLCNALFWPLFCLSLAGAYRAFKMAQWREESWLWLGPPILILCFFLLSGQTYDLLTLRYLSFWQICPFLFLGWWFVFNRKEWKMGWVLTLAVWMVFHGCFWAIDFMKPAEQHPGQRIEEGMLKAGFKSGYANFWVSETAGYFSAGQLNLEPYNHEPIYSETAWKVQKDPSPCLVWVKGLDPPDQLGEVLRQLGTLGLQPKRKFSFDGDRWFVLELLKLKAPL
jgi:hypothetical protein